MSVPTVTQTFDMAIGEYGQDYAVPVGTPIYSPVSGTIGTEDKGKQAWGKRVIVHAERAPSFAVGHLTAFAVSAGQKVSAGQLLGYSGGAVTDPSSGQSTGPHVETQFFQVTRRGVQYLDPRNVFKQFSSWEQAIFSGAGAAAGSSASSGNPVQDAVNAALSPVGDAISGAAAGFQVVALRLFWFGLGFALFSLGVFIIFFGDIEKLSEKAGDVIEKVAPEAAAAAA